MAEVNNQEHTLELEQYTIEQIPLDKRHGRYRDLFTIWFTSNLMPLTIVTGALATVLYKLPFVNTTLYEGPIARHLGGTDISWLVGSVVVGTVYYTYAKWEANAKLTTAYQADVEKADVEKVDAT
jgi:purine-cytosine permease-like protein